MSYVALYIISIGSIWWISQVGLLVALKKIISVCIPLVLIILLNVRLGKFIFKNPVLGIISVMPTAILIYKASEPLVVGINSWIDRGSQDVANSQDIVDAEVISKEDA